MKRTGLVGTLLAALIVMSAVGRAQQPAPRPAAQPQPPAPPSPPSPPAQGATSQATVTLSDPSRPGTVKVNLLFGSLTVKASSARQVVVTSRTRSDVRRHDRNEDATGLRRLGRPSGLTAEEENNVVTVTAGGMSPAGDVEIQVPTRTNLQLTTVTGRIAVEGVDGDIEVNSVNGSITLTDVSGAVVAHATNGKVLATLKQAAPQKPMSFTSLNGSVDVTLPPAVKATLKLRSDQGEVYTDFDVQIQQQASTPTVTDSRARGGRYRVAIDNSIVGSVNGGGPEFELRTFNGNIYLRKAK
jgi:hypothetical protein